MAKAIFETRDRQLIPLDDIQHINGRWNDALRDEWEARRRLNLTTTV